MELTKEHFDSSLQNIGVTLKHFDNSLSELNKRLDNMATKVDLVNLKMEIQDDMKKQSQELKDYTDEVAQIIIAAIDERLISFDKRITKLEREKVA